MAGKLKTAVVGATGYSGLELTRLLTRHPYIDTPILMKREGSSDTAAELADAFPELSGDRGYPLRPLSWTE
jgi:N-acetyl-gamma-glutamyl-phosphate reductase